CFLNQIEIVETQGAPLRKVDVGKS
ncbi:hypothetical protein CFOL_v3_33403, partial [Cephalotus follicularis]